MNIADALRELGVGPDRLTDDQKQSLDVRGFVLIREVLSTDQLADIRRRMALLHELEGQDAGKEQHQEEGTDRLSNLVDKGSAFDVFYTQPRVLSAIAHVLDGDMKLSSLASRSVLPGKGAQGLHMDGNGKPTADGRYLVCNSMWFIDDFTNDNGATRAVPGSHRFGKAPGEVMNEPWRDHPDQQILVGPAGTVLVFNSHVWHAGTTNRTAKPRRAVASYFTRREQPQLLNQRRFLSPAKIESFSPAVRCLLDVE